MQFSELVSETYTMLKQRNSSDNETLTPTTVKAALNEAYRWVAMQTGMFARSGSILAVDEQARYDVPKDMYLLQDTYYSTSTVPLTRITKDDLKGRVTGTWRSTASGTPTYVYGDGDGRIGLYPKPNVAASETITFYGLVHPHNIGNGITTFSRTGTVLTVTTNAAHGLRAGESVTASGCSTAVFNADYTVVTVPSRTTFTATVADSWATSGLTAYLCYYDGYLPLIADADLPAFHEDNHEVLMWRAVVRLGGGVLALDESVQRAVPVAHRWMEQQISELKVRSIGQ